MDSPRDMLTRHGLAAKHSWGQNFLGDAAVLADIVERRAAVARASRWCELGPGLGHLTRVLAATPVPG